MVIQQQKHELSFPWLPSGALLVLLAVGAAGDAAACNRQAVSCTEMAGQKTCRANLRCSGLSPGVQVYVDLQGSGGVVSCAPVSSSGGPVAFGSVVNFDLSAVASTSVTTQHACTWRWERAGVRGGSGTVRISEADGLPVELLEFDIDD